MLAEEIEELVNELLQEQENRTDSQKDDAGPPRKVSFASVLVRAIVVVGRVLVEPEAS